MDALSDKPDTKDSLNAQFQFGYYAELAAAADVDDLKQRVSAIVKRLGFSQYCYIRLTENENFQPRLTTLPEEMVAQYYTAGFYEQDMNRQRAKESTRAFFHSVIHDYVTRAPFESEMTHCMREICDLYKRYGYYDFYSVPIKSYKGNEHVMLTVTSQGVNPAELKRSVIECESDLRLLCEAIDFVSMQHFPETFCQSDSPRNAIINPKPLRVLDTLANNDLTINQVAEKLNISVVTANQHLKTVRKSLGTHTNYAAIKLAVLKNLIQLKKDKKYTPPTAQPD